MLGGQAGGHGAVRGSGSTELHPCQPCPGWGGPAKGAKNHPWLQAQRTQLFLAAAGVHLPHGLSLNRPLNRDWEWELLQGSEQG